MSTTMNQTEGNATFYIDYITFIEYEKQKKELGQVQSERHMFSYAYYIFAGCIVLVNILMVFSILLSRKERRHLRSWLILHMTVLHIAFAAVALPFQAQIMTAVAAGLGKNVAICKFLHFLTDILEYMSNVSIGMLGIYQCLNAFSPRLLKSVSNVLIVSIMVILPWLVTVMLTSVLRLTMSEEQFGQCYIVSDQTATTLWLILAFYVPVAIVGAALVGIIIISFSKFRPKLSPTPQTRRGYVTMFVIFCLSVCFIMRLPFYVLTYRPVTEECVVKNGFLMCNRLKQGLDIARLLSMVFIPLAYLIPKVIVKRCRKIKSKITCRSVDCSSNPKKQQAMELKAIPNNERTLL